MTVWVIIIPDNELLGVFHTKEQALLALQMHSTYKEWEGWGCAEPQEVVVGEVILR